MAGPWEKYAAPAPSEGPWSKYAAPAPAAATQDDSAARGFMLGALKPVDNIRSAVASIPGVGAALDATRAAVGRQPTANSVAANDAARAANTRGGYQVAGNIAGTLPTLALPGGPLAQGAVGGALLSDGKDVGSVLTDAAIGGVAGKVGDVALKGAAAVIGPKIGANVKKLAAAGITPTIGQIARDSGTKAGRFVAGVEDRLAGLPLVGDMINADRLKGYEQFNKAVVDRVLKPLGKSLPDGVKLGRDAVAYAQEAVDKAYREVLPKLSGQYDSTFGNRVNTIRTRANLPPEQSAQLDDIIKREVGQMFDGNRRFTGKSLSQVRDRLDKLATGFKASTNTYERDVGDALGQFREQVMALARRQNPAEAGNLRRAEQAFAEKVRLERAAASAKGEGLFTPDQYSNAVRQSDRTVRKNQFAAGKARGQADLADPASAVLPNKVPDSGSVGRFSMVNTPAALAALATAPGYAVARKGVPLMMRDVSRPQARLAEMLRLLPAGSAAPALAQRRE